jgi:hypothetical protein
LADSPAQFAGHAPHSIPSCPIYFCQKEFKDFMKTTGRRTEFMDILSAHGVAFQARCDSSVTGTCERLIVYVIVRVWGKIHDASRSRWVSCIRVLSPTSLFDGFGSRGDILMCWGGCSKRVLGGTLNTLFNESHLWEIVLYRPAYFCDIMRLLPARHLPVPHIGETAL